MPYWGRSATSCTSLPAACARLWGTSVRATIAEFHGKARFVRITGAGLRESHVHDVTITRESPNYPGGN